MTVTPEWVKAILDEKRAEHIARTETLRGAGRCGDRAPMASDADRHVRPGMPAITKRRCIHGSRRRNDRERLRLPRRSLDGAGTARRRVLGGAARRRPVHRGKNGSMLVQFVATGTLAVVLGRQLRKVEKMKG